MSDQRQQPPLTIRPAVSRRLLLYLLVVHVGALVVLATLPVHWAPRLLLGLLVAASLVYSVWAQVLHRAPWSIVEAVWSDTGWTLTTRGGQTDRARLSSSSYVGVGLVILIFRCGPVRRRSVLLLSDCIDAELLRRVRARLRISGARQARGLTGRADAAL
jgi:hypothetical protein